MPEYGADFSKVVRTVAGEVYLCTHHDVWTGQHDGRTVTVMRSDTDDLWYARIEGLDEPIPGASRMRTAVELMLTADNARREMPEPWAGDARA
jgi:hypothetical protein